MFSGFYANAIPFYGRVFGIHEFFSAWGQRAGGWKQSTIETKGWFYLHLKKMLIELRQKGRGRVPIHWVPHDSDVCSSQDGARPKARAGNSIHGSHVNGKLEWLEASPTVSSLHWQEARVLSWNWELNWESHSSVEYGYPNWHTNCQPNNHFLSWPSGNPFAATQVVCCWTLP